MALYYRILNNQIIVSGDTFRFKEEIKSHGGRFIAATKSWMIPCNDSILSRINSLCVSSGGGPLDSGTEAADDLRAPSEPASTKAKLTFQRFTPSLPIEGVTTFTIGELMSEVSGCITSRFSTPIWVVGELQNINHRQRATYLTIVEPKESGKTEASALAISANLWESARRSIELKHGVELVAQMLVEGMKVRLLCQVSLYKDRGQITLSILDIDTAFTKGALALQREKLIQELKAKGLFDRNKRLKLTAFPFRVGLISAEGSRAKSDFLDQLLLYKFPGEVMFFPTQMQGDNTPEEVVRGIKALNKIECDLIVITRGGGSTADLRWFDHPDIAHEIALSTIPILAAIGHHDDESVAEIICYQREKTPTAAADFILQQFAFNREKILEFSNLLHQRINQKLEYAAQQQLTFASQLRSLSSKKILDLSADLHSKQMNLTTLYHRVLSALTDRLNALHTGLMRGTHACIASTHNQLIAISTMLVRHKDQYLTQESARLKTKVVALEKSALEVVRQSESTRSKLKNQLELITIKQINTLETSLNQLDSSLTILDPKPWLNKGWTQLFKKGSKVSSIRELALNDLLKARITDGSLTLKVEEIGSSHPVSKE